MTSTAATIPTSYNGVDVQDLDGIFLEITGGLSDSPTVRGVDVLIPKADGQTARPRRFQERRILISGFVRGTGSTQADQRADYRSNMRSLLSLFDAAAAPADLVAELEDGSTATVACRTLSVASVEPVQSEYGTVSIEMLAVEDWSIVDAGS